MLNFNLQKKILNISIPTYNRADDLFNCLSILLPQAIYYKDHIDIHVFDNASTDNTESVINYFKSKYDFLLYTKNHTNEGYTGNQIKCYSTSNGFYTAFLSDDDIYTEDLLKKIIPILQLKLYSFLALNYYSFKNDYNKIFKSNYADESNKIFKRPYDILNHPSVGHWSGYIINTELAKKQLNFIINYKSFLDYELNRGIMGELIHRALSISTSPSYFFGQRLLAVKVQNKFDYDTIRHLCLNEILFYKSLFDQKVILLTDWEYRKKLVYHRLNIAIFFDTYNLSNTEYNNIMLEFQSIYIKDKYYKKTRLLFYIFSYKCLRILMKYLHLFYRTLKKHFANK